MIDVEQHALRALEQDALSGLAGIGHDLPDRLGIGQQLMAATAHHRGQQLARIDQADDVVQAALHQREACMRARFDAAQVLLEGQ